MKRKEAMLKLARTLVRRRDAHRETLAEHKNMIAVKDHSVGDSIDAAEECEQSELDSQLATVESREIAAIEAAIDRVRDGHYGICDRCEKPIPTARLQALPHATRCIKCQREEERCRTGNTAAFHRERVTDEPSDKAPNRLNGFELELV